MTAKTPRDCARRASTEKRIKHDIARLGAGQQYAVEQCLWLLRRMRLDAIAFQPLLPAANRQYPVGAHLQFIIQRLHLTVIERIAGVLAFRAPDPSLMRIGETRDLENGQ